MGGVALAVCGAGEGGVGKGNKERWIGVMWDFLRMSVTIPPEWYDWNDQGGKASKDW